MTPEQKAQIVLDAVSQAGNFAKAVQLLRDQGQRIGRGDSFLGKDGVRDNYYRALELGLTPSVEKPFKKEFEVQPLSSGEEPLEELIARRRAEAKRRIEAWRQNRVVKIHLKMEGPWGLAFQGDPHVDDDGTDLDALFTRAELISETPGLFACNVGDNTNNWVGRLERLYANQGTTARDAWRIAEAWLSMVDWLFLVGGNHDAWSGDRDPLYYIAKDLGVTYVPHGRVFQIIPPKGRALLTDVRHDFKGRSQWNDAFGPAKEAQMGGVCDIYACGHTHTSAYTNGYNHRSGIFWHAIRVGSDKIIDDYANQHGFGFSSIYTCPVAIIDPEATNPVNFVRWEFDTFEGAEKLTWLRQKWEAGKRVTV